MRLCLVLTKDGMFSIVPVENKYKVIQRAVFGNSGKTDTGKQKVFSVDKVDIKEGSPMILRSNGTEAFRTDIVRQVLFIGAN